MTPKTHHILYLHGFNSGPTSQKGLQLQQYVAARPELATQVMIPTLPHRPAAAIRLAEELLQSLAEETVTVVGSSLGGFYATWLAEHYPVKAVLLNPALTPGQDLVAYLGPQSNPYTQEHYVLTSEHLSELTAYTVGAIRHPECFMVIVQTGDALLDYRITLQKFRQARVIVEEGGDHALSNFATYIPAVLEFAGIPAAELMD